MSHLTIGVVGIGYMGQRFARLAQQHSRAELVGVADLNATVVVDAAAQLGVPAFSDTAALLEAAKPDALVVATVESAHVEPCVAALSRGVAVLVEKPIATTAADAQTIIEASERHHAPLMVGHVLRFDARYAGVQQAVANQDIGAPLTFAARRWNGVGAQNRLKGRCSLPIFLGVHDYDLVRWILGAEVTSVAAVSRYGHLTDLGYDVEDANFALLTMSNGAAGYVDLGWVLPPGHPSGFVQRFEVTGATGQAITDGSFSGLTVIDANRARWPETTIAPDVAGALRGSLERELDHFITSVLDGQPPSVSGQDGLAALQIALAVEESARTNQVVELK